jgi:hypothetical protein
LTPTVPFLNGDVLAAFFVRAIAPSIAPSLLICAFCRSTLAPTLTALTLFLLRITNTNLRTPVRTDAKLKLRLRN